MYMHAMVKICSKYYLLCLYILYIESIYKIMQEIYDVLYCII